jgi:hypothetical protein
MSTDRVIKNISLNDETRDVIIQFRGNSHAIEAIALDFKKDNKGNIAYLLLDRLIHRINEERFECNINNAWQSSFLVRGCVVSELKQG